MGKKKAIKITAVAVPGSLEEVTKMLGRIGTLQRRVARTNLVLDNSVARLTQRATEKISPRQNEINRLAEGIFIYGQAHRQELTEDEKKKTVELPTGQIIWRWNPYSVDFRNEKEAIVALKAKGLTEFIRTEEKVNKEAILQDKEGIKDVKGIKIAHDEMFVIKPTKTEIEIPKKIKLSKK
jgi:phage host-nuclease inhibitor protein Gam